MVRYRLWFFLFFCLVFRSLHAQQIPPTERIVSVDFENTRTDEAFWKIAELAKFDYSYTRSVFDPAKKVSLHLKNVTVRRVLDQLFEKKVVYKVRSNYIILVAAPPPLAVTTPVAAPAKKREYQLSGYITDVATGQALPDVTVYDTARIVAVLTDAYGHYALTIPGGTKPVTIKVSKSQYKDMLVTLTPTENTIADLKLERERTVLGSLVTDSTIKISDSIVVEKKPMAYKIVRWVDSLLSRSQRIQFDNLKKQELLGKTQVSFVPYLSTNGILAAKTINHFSLNIIGGYTGGTNGAELGGALNIDRGDVRFMQLSGFGNIVTGNVEGLQAAGFGNVVLKNVHGIQVGNTFNFVLDTMDGLQLSGGTNIVRGYTKGIQGAGGMNIVMDSFTGIQAAGFGNYVRGHVKYMQAASFFNMAGSVNGLQFTGGMNMSLRHVEGWQVSGGINYARGDLKGAQISSLYNYARSLKGMQFSVINHTRTLHGFQLGVINIADTCTAGVNIGLLSFVKKGIHQLEVSGNEKAYFTATFRTGVPVFYTSLVIGKGFLSSDPIWGFGYGIGTRFSLRPHWRVTVDAQLQHINTESFAKYTSDWLRLTPAIEWVPLKKINFAVGPSLNWYMNKPGKEAFAPYIGSTLLDSSTSSLRHRIWLGGTVALRLF